MNAIELISIDLDGTLLDSSGSVSDACISVLKACKEKGKILVFNTARCRQILPTSLYMQFQNDYWVLSNGTTILRDSEVLCDHHFEWRVVSPIVTEITRRYPDIYHCIEAGGTIFSTHENQCKNEQHRASKTDNSQLTGLEINKLLFILDDQSIDTNELWYPKSLKPLLTEDGHFLSIMPKSISKLSAIQFLCEQLDLTMASVMAFGNDLNDLELLQASAVGVAVKNAHPLVLEKANFITSSNDEKGVRHYLETFLQASA